jgi:tetratricopeptide (TPR) repeat protein
VLSIVEQVHGKQHPDYAASLNNLATLYAQQGRLADAIPLLKRALHIRIKVLPATHPNINAAFRSLFNMLTAAGELPSDLDPDQQEAAHLHLMQEIQQMEDEN